MSKDKDIYRNCALGKSLEESMNQVNLNQQDVVNKLWQLYDQILKQQLEQLQSCEATIEGKLETFQRIPYEGQKDTQVSRLVIKDAVIKYKDTSVRSKNINLADKGEYIKVIAYESDPKKKEKKTKKDKNDKTKKINKRR